MTQEYDGGPVFPQGGLSKLEYFVHGALAGLLATRNLIDEAAAESVAEEAVLIARAVLNELEMPLAARMEPLDIDEVRRE